MAVKRRSNDNSIDVTSDYLWNLVDEEYKLKALSKISTEMLINILHKKLQWMNKPQSCVDIAKITESNILDYLILLGITDSLDTSIISETCIKSIYSKMIIIKVLNNLDIESWDRLEKVIRENSYTKNDSLSISYTKFDGGDGRLNKSKHIANLYGDKINLIAMLIDKYKIYSIHYMDFVYSRLGMSASEGISIASTTVRGNYYINIDNLIEEMGLEEIKRQGKYTPSLGVELFEECTKLFNPIEGWEIYKALVLIKEGKIKYNLKETEKEW